MELKRDVVEVWRVPLDVESGIQSSLWNALSDPEREAVGRYRYAEDRSRHTVAHAALRLLLGAYLQADSASITFRRGPYGKPYLDGPHAGSDVEFNLSHSHGLAVCAFARGREVGVDVEYRGRRVARDRVARRFFSTAEQTALLALPDDAARAEGFFAIWTRKEAYLKATGLGINVPLASFDVPLELDARRAVLRCEHAPEDVERWSLRDVPVAPEYKAAVVVEGDDWELRVHDWTPERFVPGQPHG